ncbi:hypothetical protein DV515_00011132, partial [Chloebia gouldiae]
MVAELPIALLCFLWIIAFQAKPGGRKRRLAIGTSSGDEVTDDVIQECGRGTLCEAFVRSGHKKEQNLCPALNMGLTFIVINSYFVIRLLRQVNVSAGTVEFSQCWDCRVQFMLGFQGTTGTNLLNGKLGLFAFFNDSNYS